MGKEVRFLVPMLRNSDRELHEITHWEWLENEMHVRYPNGWQLREIERTQNAVKGRWFDKEKHQIVPDDSVEIVVAVAPDQLTALFAFFDAICDRFDQKCLYFTTGGDAALYYPTRLGLRPAPRSPDVARLALGSTDLAGDIS